MNINDLALTRFREANVLPFLLRKTGQADAEDLAHTVFMKFLRQCIKTDCVPEKPAYVRKIAQREFASWCEKRANRREAPLLDLEIETEVPANNSLASEESALGALPPRYQTVARMYFIQGLAVVQISQQLELCINTVKTRIHRARHLLRKRLMPCSFIGT